MNIIKLLTAIEWKPSVGDPTAIGWIITVAYFVAAFLCRRAGLAEKKQRVISAFPNNYWLWFGLAALLLVLGINKQLDFQTFLISLGRAIAKENGWYHYRSEVQFSFVMIAGLLGFLLFIGLLWLFRKCWRQYWLATTGLAFVILFILIRAASFNHVDYLVSKWRIIGPIRMKYAVELGGVAIIGVGAFLKLHGGFRANTTAKG